jgi:hypothetical protein
MKPGLFDWFKLFIVKFQNQLNLDLTHKNELKSFIINSTTRLDKQVLQELIGYIY